MIAHCDFNLHFLMTSEFENVFSYVCWPFGYTLENYLIKSFCSFPNYFIVSSSCHFYKTSVPIITINPWPVICVANIYFYKSFIYLLTLCHKQFFSFYVAKCDSLLYLILNSI